MTETERYYHYVLSLQWVTAAGLCANTTHGTVSIRPGDSRQSVYWRLVSEFYENRGIDTAAGAVTLFFSLEPDVLETAGQMAAEESRR